MGQVTPWTTGRDGLDVPPAGGVLDRRGVLVLGRSSQLLLRRLDISDVGPVDRVAVRARTTPPTSVDLPPPSRSGAEKDAGSLRADVPGSRTHPAPPVVASYRCSVCSRCCWQLSKAPCTGGRAPASGAFAAAALLQTAFVPWQLRSSHPMLDPRFFRIPASRHGVGHYHRSSSSWRHVTMVQRRSGSLSLPRTSFWLYLVRRAGYVPGRSRRTPVVVSALSLLAVVPVGWGSAARSAWSSRPMTRSLVSGNRWP
jgi:hypothetical protein